MKAIVEGQLFKDGVTFKPTIEKITEPYRLVSRVFYAEIGFGARIEELDESAGVFRLITKVFDNVDVTKVTLDRSNDKNAMAANLILRFVKIVSAFSYGNEALKKEVFGDKLDALTWLSETNGRLNIACTMFLHEAGIKFNKKLDQSELLTLVAFLIAGDPIEDIRVLVA